MKPNTEGLFLSEPEETYHADGVYEIPSLSASLAKILIEATPMHCAWQSPRLNPKFKPKNTDRFDRGKIAHAWTLRSDAAIAEIKFDDWRTKDAKAAREAARAAGKIPCLSSDYAELKDMVEAGKSQLDALEGGNPFAQGQPEVVIRWRETFAWEGSMRSVWCRARLDWLNVESDNAYDLKSTEASAMPSTWTKRTMWGIGAPYQAAFYRRGLRRLTQLGILKMHDPDFIFIVAESNPPYALSQISVPSDIIVPYSGDVTADRKLTEAMALWADCLEQDNWPGYPTGVYVAESFGRKQHRGEPATAGASFHQESQDVPDEAFTPIEFKRNGA